MSVFTYGAREFGRFPVAVYGEGVLNLMTYVIPLALFQYYPFLYLIGREEGVFGIVSPILALVFVIPSYAFYRFAFSKYRSTGS